MKIVAQGCSQVHSSKVTDLYIKYVRICIHVLYHVWVCFSQILEQLY